MVKAIKETNYEEKKKRANQLNGKTWTKYSISVWSDIRKNKQELSLKHPAMFPVELPKRLIEIFTHDKKALVLDPFAGVGGTIVAAQEMGRDAVGIELYPEYAQTARERLKQASLFSKDAPVCVVHTADARKLQDYVNPSTVDLVVTSPPYWDILLEKRTADYKDQRDYGDQEADLGNIREYRAFLTELKSFFSLVYETMKSGAYCCVVVMDLRKKSIFFPYHSDLAEDMKDIGFIYDDVIIWDRRHEYNNMRPLGYPYRFRVNKAHEFILIFLKP